MKKEMINIMNSLKREICDEYGYDSLNLESVELIIITRAIKFPIYGDLSSSHIMRILFSGWPQ